MKIAGLFSTDSYFLYEYKFAPCKRSLLTIILFNKIFILRTELSRIASQQQNCKKKEKKLYKKNINLNVCASMCAGVCACGCVCVCVRV